MTKYREIDLLEAQPLASSLTVAQIKEEPEKVVKEIAAAATKPSHNWGVAHDQVPVAYVSRFVEKALKGGRQIDQRKLRVVDAVARAVVNRLEFARWNYKSETSLVDRVDDELGLSILMRTAFMRAEIQAVTYMFIWPNADNTALGMVRIEPDTCIVGYPLDGHSIWPEWGARISRVNPSDKRMTQLDLYEEGFSTRWTRSDADWELVYEDVPYRTGWERVVPIVPLVCEDLHAPESGVEAALGPQLAINHAIMLDAGSAEYAGFPLRWTAESAPELNTGEVDYTRGFNLDNQFTDDEDDDDDDDGKPIDIYPGAFIKLQADSVGEFKAAQLEATLGRVQEYGKMAFILSEVPLSYWTGTSANNSGELMRREIQPLLGRAYRRIRFYTAAYKRIWQILGGQSSALASPFTLPESVVPVFRDPAWPDEMYIWELAGLQLDAGLPETFVYEKAGLSPQEIERIESYGRERGDDRGDGPSRGRRNRGDGANIS